MQIEFPLSAVEKQGAAVGQKSDDGVFAGIGGESATFIKIEFGVLILRFLDLCLLNQIISFTTINKKMGIEK